jgi:hypothetical protein
VIAVVPQQDLAPFYLDRFQRENSKYGITPEGFGGANRGIEDAEATGIGFSSSIIPDQRSRIPFSDLRTEPTSHPRWPSSRDAATPSRYRARARRLPVEQESAIRALAGTRSLRSLAVDFGVSHETIRAVVRQKRSATR